jgi:nicotinate-nucleotide adenylyltransferase
MAVVRAAQRRFHLDEIHFVVAGRHPFRQKHDAAPFPHRYAMVALACAEHRHYVPSLLEAGEDFSGRHTSYSVDTVAHFRQRVAHRGDRLFFLCGVDAFLDIPHWKEYETLLNACDFIVISRPGFRLEPLRLVIPPSLVRKPRNGHAARDPRAIALRRSTVHILDTVRSHVSSTEIRRRRQRGQSIHGLVPMRVEDYILQQGLYR